MVGASPGYTSRMVRRGELPVSAISEVGMPLWQTGDRHTSGELEPTAVSPDHDVVDARRDRSTSVSVVICAYTLKRWEMLEASVASCLRQTALPDELIVCIDHNPDLLAKCQAAAPKWGEGSPVGLTVVANRFDGRLGSARTTAVNLATGDIVAFLDDDASAERDWLENLVRPFVEDHAVAVGGAPLPVYQVPKPRWFPPQFHWVFGCAYVGLPEQKAPLAHLIGANMAARRDALIAIGGFHSDNHDDMDMCHRLAHAFPGQPILYEPR